MKRSVSFIRASVCFLVAFGAFSVYSDDACEKEYTKPKTVKLLPPERISLLSREELHSLQPKHLFLKQKGERWGGLRLTVEQFQSLDLNNLHPKTFKVVVSHKYVLDLVSDAQIQALDLNRFPPDILYSLMISPLAEKLSPNLQTVTLHFGRWSAQNVELFLQHSSLVQYMDKAGVLKRIPRKILIDILFERKSIEFYEDNFKIVLKAILYIDTRDQYVSLSIDQIEALIRNPYIISPEEFDKIKNEESEDKEAYYSRVYNSIEGKDMPEDFRTEHFFLLTKRISSRIISRFSSSGGWIRSF